MSLSFAFFERQKRGGRTFRKAQSSLPKGVPLPLPRKETVIFRYPPRHDLESVFVRISVHFENAGLHKTWLISYSIRLSDPIRSLFPYRPTNNGDVRLSFVGAPYVTQTAPPHPSPLLASQEGSPPSPFPLCAAKRRGRHYYVPFSPRRPQKILRRRCLLRMTSGGGAGRFTEPP